MVDQLNLKQRSVLTNYLIDAMLLLSAFLLVYFTKRGHLDIEHTFMEIIPVYYFVWLISTLLSRKFKPVEKDVLLLKIKPFFLSILLMAGFLSIFLYGFKLFNLSRFIVWGSLAVFLVLEIFFLSGFYVLPRILKKDSVRSPVSPSFFFFTVEFIVLSGVYLGVYFYKKGTIEVSESYLIILMGIYLAWLYVSLTTHKFVIPRNKNYLKVIWPFIKSALIILSMVSFFIFTFRVLEYSRLVVLGAVLGFAVLELFIVTIYYIYRKPRESDEVELELFNTDILFEPEPIEKVVEKRQRSGQKYRIPFMGSDSHVFKTKLHKVYLKNQPDVFDFLDQTLDLNIDILHSEAISSGNPYNVEILPENNLQFLLNLHEVNDFRRINQYFIRVNEILIDGGVFVSRFMPLEKRKAHFRKRYPRILANILYILDFIWRRIFPKLPLMQKLYFGLTRGRRRVLSKAETLGRLYFCGFEIISLKDIEEYIYFIARKAKKPETDKTPSYSPVFKMQRSGKNGHDIYVYKFRTMYPYSEFLQSYLLEVTGYGTNGKIENDFRVTTWGRFLRRYWLDELPQLINLFKGEMRLVGIRPISARFLQEFPEDIRQLRMKYKPGCIPAYVALLKQSKDGFIEAETIYLREKEKHAIWTDVKYIYLAISNIITNKIRSA